MSRGISIEGLGRHRCIAGRSRPGRSREFLAADLAWEIAAQLAAGGRERRPPTARRRAGLGSHPAAARHSRAVRDAAAIENTVKRLQAAGLPDESIILQAIILPRLRTSMGLALQHGLLTVAEHGDVREGYQLKWLRAELLHATTFAFREAHLTPGELREELEKTLAKAEPNAGLGRKGNRRKG